MDLGAMLAGKRVLVTGASSGLGENFARLAAGCKAKVVIAARRKAKLDALALNRCDIDNRATAASLFPASRRAHRHKPHTTYVDGH